jgi:hypothetical protein
MRYYTRNGAECLPLGPRRFADGSATHAEAKREALQYLQCQMLPAHPQRIEWVREDNIRAVDDRHENK